MLIRDAEVGGVRRDVRIVGDRIAAIAGGLVAGPGEAVVQARRGALLPGLHDHHIHLDATAAALSSVRCGPPEVRDEAALAAVLHAAPGAGWLRGIGYHPGVGVDIDRAWLDRHGPDRPVRIQHRSGRMWIVNSRAADRLGRDVPGDGRLIDRDSWLRDRLGAAPPDLRPVGALLAGFGVTGLTEVTPRNRVADYLRYAAADLPQHMLVMGTPELEDAPVLERLAVGPVKLHHHDHDLPSLDSLVAEVGRAHAAGRAIAAHCVTAAELMLTLSAIEAAGPHEGDRIEHAAIVTPENARWMAALGVTVVTQPHFITERGDAYRADVAPEDLRWLYRLRGLVQAGIGIAAGSDAPFGDPNPWRAMAAAVERPAAFCLDERLTPEDALALYTGAARAPAGQSRGVAVGERADLCLIDRPWHAARRDLGAVRVCATIIEGKPVHADCERR